jgi:agmatinase
MQATSGPDRQPLSTIVIQLEAPLAIVNVSAIPVLLGGDDSVPIPFFEAFEINQPSQSFKLMPTSTAEKSETAYATRFRVRCGAQVKCLGWSASSKWACAAAADRGNRISTMLDTGAHRSFRLLPCADRVSVRSQTAFPRAPTASQQSTVMVSIVPQPGGLSFIDVMELYGLAAKARIEGIDVLSSFLRDEIGALAAARFICKAIRCIARQRRRGEHTSSYRRDEFDRK